MAPSPVSSTSAQTTESGPSKGFKKKDSAFHVCYCHSPLRYLYDMKNEYLENLSEVFDELDDTIGKY